jgi:hypothetical protein
MVHLSGGGRFWGARAIYAVRPTYFQLGARARSPALDYTAPTTVHGSPRQKGCDLVFCERLPLSIRMRGPCFQVLNGWTLLGVDATCRHIPVPCSLGGIRFGDCLAKNG